MEGNKERMSAYEDKSWIWVLIFMVSLLAVSIMFKVEMGILAMVVVIVVYFLYLGFSGRLNGKQFDLRSLK